MKGALVLSLLFSLAGCDVYMARTPTTHHNAHDHYEYTTYTYCDESEPYWEFAEEYIEYYDHYGYWEGECGIWYVGNGYYEEWCIWQDSCGWEFVHSWRESWYY